MVFWKTYPKNIIKKAFNNATFTDLSFERPDIQTPTGYNYEILNKPHTKILTEIQKFIKTHFGSPPNTPVLDIPADKLLNEKDIILYVRDKTGHIAGCIRYHYLGQFISDKGQEIYCEDCFCIHPKWRKKGVGDYLLTQLHIYVNKNNIPYSMFLKEGAQLSIINPPFY
jgi:GNAT superfamily N-acetyltransferase